MRCSKISTFIKSQKEILRISYFAHCHLVGGFNPSEKYACQIGSFPQVGVKIKNIWNHHLVMFRVYQLIPSNSSPISLPFRCEIQESFQGFSVPFVQAQGSTRVGHMTESAFGARSAGARAIIDTWPESPTTWWRMCFLPGTLLNWTMATSEKWMYLQ